MKKFLVTAALTVLALPAIAVDDVGGYRCENSCPLASQANALRAYGLEAPIASVVMRSELAEELEASLARI